MTTSLALRDTPLCMATCNNHIDAVRLLIESGADMVNYDFQSMPLYKAIMLGHMDIARVFLDNGVDINAKYPNMKNETMLDEVMWPYGTVIHMERLLECGYDPNYVDSYKNNSLLMDACATADDDKMHLLLKYGANPNISTRYGVTPLHRCASKGKYVNESHIKLLLSHGANPNVCDSNDRTPLHVAASSGSTCATVLLIEGGAYINCVDRFGESPLHKAARNEHRYVIRTLVKYGIDMTICNNDGLTAIELIGRP